MRWYAALNGSIFGCKWSPWWLIPTPPTHVTYHLQVPSMSPSSGPTSAPSKVPSTQPSMLPTKVSYLHIAECPVIDKCFDNYWYYPDHNYSFGSYDEKYLYVWLYVKSFVAYHSSHSIKLSSADAFNVPIRSSHCPSYKCTLNNTECASYKG